MKFLILSDEFDQIQWNNESFSERIINKYKAQLLNLKKPLDENRADLLAKILFSIQHIIENSNIKTTNYEIFTKQSSEIFCKVLPVLMKDNSHLKNILIQIAFDQKTNFNPENNLDLLLDNLNNILDTFLSLTQEIKETLFYIAYDLCNVITNYFNHIYASLTLLIDNLPSNELNDLVYKSLELFFKKFEYQFNSSCLIQDNFDAWKKSFHRDFLNFLKDRLNEDAKFDSSFFQWRNAICCDIYLLFSDLNSLKRNNVLTAPINISSSGHSFLGHKNNSYDEEMDTVEKSNSDRSDKLSSKSYNSCMEELNYGSTSRYSQ